MAARPYASRMRNIPRATLSRAASHEIGSAGLSRARSGAAALQAVGMVDALDLAEAAGRRGAG
jgi:hypothetical protein